MTNYQKTIIFIALCSITIIIVNTANTISIKKSIEKIENRADKKLTKENKK
jgi:tetrahydromethanopterin S-methyltransferase subunit F